MNASIEFEIIQDPQHHQLDGHDAGGAKAEEEEEEEGWASVHLPPSTITTHHDSQPRPHGLRMDSVLKSSSSNVGAGTTSKDEWTPTTAPAVAAAQAPHGRTPHRRALYLHGPRGTDSFTMSRFSTLSDPQHTTVTVAAVPVGDISSAIVAWAQDAGVHKQNHLIAAEVYQRKYRRMKGPWLCLAALVASLSSLDAVSGTLAEAQPAALQWFRFAISVVIFFALLFMLLLQALHQNLWKYDTVAQAHTTRSTVMARFRLRCEGALLRIRLSDADLEEEDPAASLVLREEYTAIMAERDKLLETNPRELPPLPNHPHIQRRTEATPLVVPVPTTQRPRRRPRRPQHRRLSSPTESAHSSSSSSQATTTTSHGVRTQLLSLLHTIRAQRSDTGDEEGVTAAASAAAAAPLPTTLHHANTRSLQANLEQVLRTWKDEEAQRVERLTVQVARWKRARMWWGIALAVPQVLAGVGGTHLVSVNGNVAFGADTAAAADGGSSAAETATAIGITCMVLAQRLLEQVMLQMDLDTRIAETTEHVKQLRGFVDRTTMVLQSRPAARHYEQRVAQVQVLCDLRKHIRDAFPLVA